MRGAHGFKETGRYSPGVAAGPQKLGLRLAAFPFVGTAFASRLCSSVVTLGGGAVRPGSKRMRVFIMKKITPEERRTVIRALKLFLLSRARISTGWCGSGEEVSCMGGRPLFACTRCVQRDRVGGSLLLRRPWSWSAFTSVPSTLQRSRHYGPHSSWSHQFPPRISRIPLTVFRFHHPESSWSFCRSEGGKWVIVRSAAGTWEGYTR